MYRCWISQTHTSVRTDRYQNRPNQLSPISRRPSCGVRLQDMKCCLVTLVILGELQPNTTDLLASRHTRLDCWVLDWPVGDINHRPRSRVPLITRESSSVTACIVHMTVGVVLSSGRTRWPTSNMPITRSRAGLALQSHRAVPWRGGRPRLRSRRLMTR